MALVGFPASIVMDANGCTAVYTLINSGMTDLVIKIKTSNIVDYTFKPVHAFIKSGETKQIEILRKKGPPKNDKFLVQYAAAPSGGAKDAQSAFGASKMIGQICIGLFALP